MPLLAEFVLPSTFFVGLLGSALFGLVGIVLLLLGYFGFDKVTPKLDLEGELMKGNIAVGVALAGLFLGIAYIVAHVVH